MKKVANQYEAAAEDSVVEHAISYTRLSLDGTLPSSPEIQSTIHRVKDLHAGALDATRSMAKHTRIPGPNRRSKLTMIAGRRGSRMQVGGRS